VIYVRALSRHYCSLVSVIWQLRQTRCVRRDNKYIIFGRDWLV